MDRQRVDIRWPELFEGARGGARCVGALCRVGGGGHIKTALKLLSVQNTGERQQLPYLHNHFCL